MRKESIVTKNLLKGVIFTLLFFLMGAFLLTKVEAAICDEVNNYNFSTQSSCTTKETFPIVALNRTATETSSIVTMEPASYVFANVSQDERGTCGSCLYLENLRALGYDVDSGDPQGIYSDDDWNELLTICPEAQCDFNSTVVGAKANGSILGVTKLASNKIISEPMPVNLAFYTKHNLQKIPVIGQTAYAQNVSYNALGLEFVLGIWEKTRNVAYAIMSVIMLIIGILIVTQRKINPQTVVTVQSALPRVVISLFLITFSYPIGAILASLVMPLMAMAIGFFVGARAENFANMNFLVTLTTLATMVLGPQGLLGILSGTLLGLLTTVVMLIAMVKIIFVQMKILVQIVLAPIQFAISAIPGQEHLVADWFKSMAAKVLSIPAIMFMVALAWYWPNEFLTNPDNFSGIVTGSGPLVFGLSFLRNAVSHSLTIVMIPILQIMTLFMAVKADKKVEAFILGDQKRRR